MAHSRPDPLDHGGVGWRTFSTYLHWPKVLLSPSSHSRGETVRRYDGENTDDGNGDGGQT